MPRAPKHCGIQGCTTIVPTGHCDQHQHGWGKSNPRTTTTAHRTWAKAIRQRDQRCMIRQPGCTGGADTADHIKPVAFGGAEHDLTNGQAACWYCHSRKSSREGNAARG